MTFLSLAAGAALVPSIAFAQTAHPPKPWEDVPEAHLRAPAHHVQVRKAPVAMRHAAPAPVVTHHGPVRVESRHGMGHDGFDHYPYAERGGYDAYAGDYDDGYADYAEGYGYGHPDYPPPPPYAHDGYGSYGHGAYGYASGGMITETVTTVTTAGGCGCHEEVVRVAPKRHYKPKSHYAPHRRLKRPMPGERG